MVFQRKLNGSTIATLTAFCLFVLRTSAAPNNNMANNKIKGKSSINQAKLVYPREQIKFNNHVQNTMKSISTMKIVDVFATLQLTFPKQ